MVASPSIACPRWLVADPHAFPTPVKRGKSRQILANEPGCADVGSGKINAVAFAEYCFVPGLRALHWLARLGEDAEETAQH
jgi:hypothetical protein